MLKLILQGEPPSSAFKNLINTNPALTNFDLALMWCDEFIGVDSLAVQVIWGWKRPGKNQGLSDENLDAHLVELLKKAKYL
jgi:hypothetical protein